MGSRSGFGGSWPRFTAVAEKPNEPPSDAKVILRGSMDIFAKRGINPDVVTIRGYQRYENPDDVYAVDWRWRFFPGNLRKWCSKGSGSPGWVMPKYSVLPGVHDPLAQLRPDRPIRSKTKGHDHDGMTHLATDCPCTVKNHSESVLRRPQEPMGAHERGLHEKGKHHLDESGNPLLDPDTGEPIPLEGPHRHVEFAKYLLPPGPHGIRLERHPSTSFTEHHDRVFFVLEGTPKNDSLVSRGEASFDVPSVTTWWKERMEGIDRFLSPAAPIDDAAFESYRRGIRDAFQEGVAPWETGSELQTFAETYLRGTPVIVICDSAWRHNPEVATQALVCRDKLRGYGCPAMVAAPPEGPVRYVDENGREIRQKVGVDDFLGRVNGSRDGDPDDLLIVDPQPGPGFERFARDYKGEARKKGRKAFSAEIDIALLRWGIKHSAATGEFKRPVPTVARQMEVRDRTVFNATARLQDSGAFLIDELTPLVDQRFIHVLNRRRALPLGYGHDGKTPTIVLREDLKPVSTPMTVGEWLRTL